MKNNYFIYMKSILIFLCLSGCEQMINETSAFYYNQIAERNLKNKNNLAAYDYVLKSKEVLPNEFRLDSNLGIVLFAIEKSDESIKSFDESMNAISRSELKDQQKQMALFSVYFNKGVSFGAQKKIDDAIKSYQQSLDINPVSNEAKMNIELLTLEHKKQQDQKKKDQQKQDQQNKDQKDNKDQNGDSNNQNKQDPKDDQKNEDKNQDDQKTEEQKEKEKKENAGKDRKENKKYEPRPFKGDQLSEGDVKKILGELSQQDKKIRKQFDKKENKQEGKNEKDW